MRMQVGTYLLLSWLPERMTGRGASRRLAQAARLGRLAASSGKVKQGDQSKVVFDGYQLESAGK